ncbi:MAG: 1-deoxy-D-xylulose-5-phosphate reductoisomerase [Lachnospiraceae bacterium]|nr:1-deoxy-D-xylulose-5-phosphate reductoisomerase [Lachnospiraceae bacterium]
MKYTMDMKYTIDKQNTLNTGIRRKIAILGSTGSIGTQTLEIVRDNEDLQVMALAAGGNVELMEEQIREFKPKLAVMWSEKAAADLKQRVADLPVRIAHGMEGLLELAVLPEAEVLVTAIVGMIGIKPTIAAIEAGKTIALANKETLVCAGHLIMSLAKERGVSILPVDSEHSAIFQSINGEPKNRISKILLTASGGPFRGRTLEQLRQIRPEDALKHPNWAMGRKVTIDSSTMVNKGLEVMEAGWLFDVKLSDIQVVVHPQSVIHSMVEYVDGAVMAQLGTPDMKLPIQYALFYPDRRPMAGRRLDFYELGQLTFEKPDLETFRGLKLAYRTGEIGGSMPTVFNAANEKAVSLFLENQIAYLQIPEIIEACMQQHKVMENPSVEQILQAEEETYRFIMEQFQKKA